MEFGDLFSKDFLSPDDMFGQMWQGDNKAEMQRIAKRQMRKLMDKQIITRYFGKAMRLSGQSQQFNDGAINILQATLSDKLSGSNLTDKFIKPISDLIGERMKNLPPEEYHHLITASFEEDQWILVVLGGALGFTAGLCQLIYLFGGGLF